MGCRPAYRKNNRTTLLGQTGLTKSALGFGAKHFFQVRNRLLAKQKSTEPDAPYTNVCLQPQIFNSRMAKTTTLEPVRPRPGSDAALKRIYKLSWLLDNSIRIPIIGYRIGLDALIGLIPGLGDATGLALSAYIIYEASRYGIPKKKLLQMLANTGLETVAGFVPVLGDVFDMAWKANARNVALLHEHLGVQGAPKPPSTRRVVFTLLAVVTALVLLVGLAVFFFVSALTGLVTTP